MLAFHFPYSEQTNPENGRTDDVFESYSENMEVDEECEDEITNLKRTYNNLLNSIRELLERTKEEEKIIQEK